MLSLWIREIIGWVFIGIAFYMFLICMSDLNDDPPRFVEGGMVAVIGLAIFRGGIHLIKVATACRVVLWTDRNHSVRDAT